MTRDRQRWLCADAGRCTCTPHYGAHERYCGLDEVGPLDRCDMWDFVCIPGLVVVQ